MMARATRIARTTTVAMSFVVMAACSSPGEEGSPPSQSSTSDANTPAEQPDGSPASASATTEGAPDPTPSTTTSPSPSSTGAAGDEPERSARTIRVDAADVTGQVDPRVLGTNVPAWLGPSTLADPRFRAALENSGVTMVRMPGGSWANSYDWLECERGGDGCYWPWAARPSDFLDLVEATGLAGMWTASINETAQQAAAMVAFANGAVDDRRPLGVDRDGVDWGTVGQWAGLRAVGGHPDPVRIGLWEVGNEVFAGSQTSAGEQCAPFGWEDVWTCDPVAYVEGDVGHDGYLAIREAMRFVDPTIEVGAVGVADPTSWANWGNDVVGRAGDDLDFYVVHWYAFDAEPDIDDVVTQPAEQWPPILDALDPLLGGTVELAVTEYNLAAFADADPEALMTSAANALFLVETIGQFVQNEVPIANQWNFANGADDAGRDYGLIRADGFAPYPGYFAFVLWSGFGGDLLSVDPTAVPDPISVYAARDEAGAVTLLVVNPSEEQYDIDIVVDGLDGPGTVEADWLAAPDLASETVDFNGRPADVTGTPPDGVSRDIALDSPFGWDFPPRSATLLTISSDGDD